MFAHIEWKLNFDLKKIDEATNENYPLAPVSPASRVSSFQVVFAISDSRLEEGLLRFNPDVCMNILVPCLSMPLIPLPFPSLLF